MALILVVEQEGRYIERIHDALTGEGWRVKVVNGGEAALQAAAAEAPQLVLVNSEAQGAAHVLGSFARRRGGPGSVALTPERSTATAADLGADEVLAKPFTDQELRLHVRRALATVREGRPADARPVPGRDGRQLTSEEIFGDVLAEVEGGGSRARAAAQRGAVQRGTVERKLEETLSGVLGADKPRAKEARPAGGGRPGGREASVDELISRTLSGLDLPKGRTAPKPPSPKPADPEPPAAAPQDATVAPSVASAEAFVAPTWEEFPLDVPVQAESPAAASEPPPAPVASVSTASESPAVPPPGAARAKGPGAGATSPGRRSTGEIDLAQLDELARPRSRPAAVRRETPEPPPLPADLGLGEDRFRTQRLPTVRPQAPESREFGQYTLLERIAVGGMAELWKARMKGVEGFQKTVAIKKILPHLTDSVDFVTMFIDEAKLAAQLTHQNIIHIYDLGKLGDDYYIAMEYVEGKDLRSILNAARNRNLPVPPGLALLIGARVAAALDHAHRKRDFDNRELGLVHRDVSPQNVLISYEGDIKLCDFGIVKAVAKASQTQMGALKGKLQYMSPEQAWGKAVDPRSDIFSLGSLLFEMLTGRRLFAGDSEISVLEAVRECRIQGPRVVLPTIPEELDRVVVKALAREPGDRFQSAGALQKELERLLYAQQPAPGQADLAAYMRRLFDGEARAQSPAATAEPLVAAAPVTASGGGSVSKAGAAVVAPATGAKIEEGEGRGKGLLMVAIAAALVAAVGLYFVLGRTAVPVPEGEAPPPVEQGALGVEPPAAEVPEGTAAAPVTEGVAPAGEPLPAPAGAAPASAEAAAPAGVDVAKLVDAELSRREQEMRQQFEESRRRLEQELAKTRAAGDAEGARATEAERQRLTREQAEAERRPREAVERRAGEAPPPAPASPPAEPPTAAPAAAVPLAPPPAAVEPLPVTPPAVVEAAPAASEPPPAPAPASAPAEIVPAPVAPPPAPTVKLGDLVSSGRGVVPPALVTMARPSYPPLAKRQRIEGDVSVEVLVDENGNVAQARIVKRVAQNVGLNEAAEAAARTARFKPATKDGVRVRMWFTLTFPFRL